MPKAFPAEFRADVIAVVGKDSGISEACLHRWLKIADRDDSADRTGSPVTRDESVELREARRRRARHGDLPGAWVLSTQAPYKCRKPLLK